MKTTHTPGAWTYREGSTPHFQSLIYSEETGEDIAVTYNDENGHNARLIAAAPELLKALQRVIHPMADDSDIEFAKEVIQKATNQ